MLLSPAQITALTIAYKVYRAKKKLERKTIEWIFYKATGKKLGNMYYSIPIVKRLLELQG